MDRFATSLRVEAVESLLSYVVSYASNRTKLVSDVVALKILYRRTLYDKKKDT